MATVTVTIEPTLYEKRPVYQPGDLTLWKLLRQGCRARQGWLCDDLQADVPRLGFHAAEFRFGKVVIYVVGTVALGVVANMLYDTIKEAVGDTPNAVVRTLDVRISRPNGDKISFQVGEATDLRTLKEMFDAAVQENDR